MSEKKKKSQKRGFPLDKVNCSLSFRADSKEAFLESLLRLHWLDN